MKRHLRKFWSILLVMALLITSAWLPTGSRTAQAEAEFSAIELTNSGFENGMDGWESDQTVETFKSNNAAAKTGSYSFNFWNSTAVNFTCTQTIKSLPAGTYKMTAQSQGDTGEKVYVYFNGETGDVFQEDSGWGVWQESSGTFTLSDTTANVKVGVYVECAANGWGYIDDITLTGQISEAGLLSIAKADLQEVIDSYNGLTETDYKADSWASFQTALNQATAALNDSEATTESINAAKAQLQAAKANLTAASAVANAGINVAKVENLSDDFVMGADVSSYVSIRESGAVFHDWDGNVIDDQAFFNLLKEAGINYIRIRVWNNPYDTDGNGYGGGNNDVEKAKIIGKWATDAGMKVLIDFHYSDFWADPGKQQAPKAWKDFTVDQKVTAIGQWTTDSLTEIIDAGVDVGMVQIGNETTNGICGVYHKDGWTDTAKIFNAGSQAVRAIDSSILIAIHFTNPERTATIKGFADNLNKYNVDYDVFATSYYPFWHGTTANLTEVLKYAADTYGKKGMVAETSWGTSLDDGDGHGNTLNNKTDTSAYPISIQGQADELQSVIQAVANVGQNGLGMMYWEPAWIPVQVYDADADNADEILQSNKEKWEKDGSGWAASYAAEYDPDDAGEWFGGSAVDNQALFDFYGNPLESLNVFKYVRTGATTHANQLTNGGFEDGKTGWTIEGDGVDSTLTTDPRNGTQALHFSSAQAVDFTLKQSITVKKRGVYEAFMYVQGKGTAQDVHIQLINETSDTSSKATAELKGRKNWQKPSIKGKSGINADAGDTLTVLITVKADAGAEGTLDEVCLYRDDRTVSFIKYELDGGENHADNPSAFEATETVTLKDPTKEGYEFKGWFTDANYTTSITQIEAGTENDITVYAKWEEVKATEEPSTSTTPPSPSASAAPGSSPSPDASAAPGGSPSPNASVAPGSSPSPNASAAPGGSPSPNASAAPGGSPSPNASAAPGSSPSPNASVAPGGSPSPDASVAPGGSPSPNASAAPGGSPSPDASAAPGGSPSPNASVAPGSSSSPNVSAAPGSSPSPNASVAPGSSSSPNASVAPGSSSSPDVSAAPGGSPSPDASVAPGGSPSPDASTAPSSPAIPDKSPKPEESTAPSTSVPPSANATATPAKISYTAVAGANGTVQIIGSDGNIASSTLVTTADGTMYYTNEYGVAVTQQLVTVGEDKYFAKDNGAIAKNEFCTIANGGIVYATENGTIAVNRVITVGEDKYYATKSGTIAKGGFYTKTNGSKVYATKSGKLLTAKKFTANGKKYYAKPSGTIAANGFCTMPNGKKVYAKASGALKTNTTLYGVNGKKYYANKNGNIVTDKLVTTPKGRTLYANKDGSLATGTTVNVNGNKYYAKPSGTIAKDGFCKTADGSKVYATKSGKLATDKKVTSKSGKKYYATSSGTIATNGFYTTAKGKKVYATASGALKTNTFLYNVDGDMFYADKNGNIVKNKWITVGNTKYYCSKNGKITKTK